MQSTAVDRNVAKVSSVVCYRCSIALHLHMAEPVTNVQL
jgi:hypothetical protein